MSFERYERPINPQWLSYSDGFFAQKLVHEDVYFQEDEVDSPKGLRLDRHVAALSPKHRECVELYVYGRQSYRDIARWKDWRLKNGKIDAKKAWRCVQRGLRTLREDLERADEVDPLSF